MSECCFSFRHPYYFWKGIYAREKQKRMTRRRQGRFVEETGFDWKKPPQFWPHLCPDCWAVCSKPFDGFPMDWHETVFLAGLANPLVPTK